MKKWVVRLEAEERQRLEQLVRVGKAAAYKIRHAHVLLAVDESEQGPGCKDEEVSRTLLSDGSCDRDAAASLRGRRAGILFGS